MPHIEQREMEMTYKSFHIRRIRHLYYVTKGRTVYCVTPSYYDAEAQCDRFARELDI